MEKKKGNRYRLKTTNKHGVRFITYIEIIPLHPADASIQLRQLFFLDKKDYSIEDRQGEIVRECKDHYLIQRCTSVTLETFATIVDVVIGDLKDMGIL